MSEFFKPHDQGDDAADERVVWVAKNIMPMFQRDMQDLKTDLVKAFEAVVEKSIGALTKRQDAIEERHDELDQTVRRIQPRAIFWSVAASSAWTVALIFFGKMRGWWL